MNYIIGIRLERKNENCCNITNIQHINYHNIVMLNCLNGLFFVLVNIKSDSKL